MNWTEVEQQLAAGLGATPHGEKGQVAQSLGISATHLSQVISGKRRLSRDLAERAADHLGLTLSYALGGKGKPSS